MSSVSGSHSRSRSPSRNPSPSKQERATSPHPTSSKKKAQQSSSASLTTSQRSSSLSVASPLAEMEQLSLALVSWETDIESRLPEEVYLDVISLQAYAENIERGYGDENDEEHHASILRCDQLEGGIRQREAALGIRLGVEFERMCALHPHLLSQLSVVKPHV